jgi:hypothetical protein
MADQNRTAALATLHDAWCWGDNIDLDFCWGEYDYAGIPFWAPTAIVNWNEADGPIYLGLFSDTAPDLPAGIYPGGEHAPAGAELLQDAMLLDFLEAVGRRLSKHTTRFDDRDPRVPRHCVTPS